MTDVIVAPAAPGGPGSLLGHRHQWTHTLRFVAGLTSLFAWSGVAGALALTVLAPLLSDASPVVVTSDSMSPQVAAGDVLLVAPVQSAELVAGRIVVFRDLSRDSLVAHRVQAVEADGSIVTRGDANPTDDSTPVYPDQVAGAAVLAVPHIGTPWVWASEGRWGVVGLAVATAIAGLWASRWALIGRHHPWSLTPAVRSSDSRRAVRGARR